MKRWTVNPETWGAVVSILGFVLLWYILTAVLKLPRFDKLPNPVAVFSAWLSPHPQFGLSIFTRGYYLDILYSVGRVLAAFVLATVLGVGLGLLMGWSRVFFDYSFPLVETLRPIPPIAWIPLAVLVLPTAELGVIFITFIAAFFATVLNTLLGVRSIDEVYFRAASCLGSRPRDVFWNVVVPGALPAIFTGLQVAMGIAWISLVAGEMIAGQRGLGYLIYEDYSNLQFVNIVIGMATLGLLGYGSSALVRMLGRRLMAWEGRRRGGAMA
jgi:NitT/TauT family transport system permease protein